MKYLTYILGVISGLLLTVSPAPAASGLSLHNFTPNTAAHADSVDENFAELEKAVPVMWASIDQDPAAIAFTVASTGAVINDLTNIIVPDPGGILLINGSVFLNNDEALALPFVLNPLINGVGPENHAFMSYFVASGQSSVTAQGVTLSYTYATAVAAAVLTVSQELKPYLGPAIFTFNKNNLTVVFFPTLPGGAGINFPGIPAGAHTFFTPVCEEGDLCP